VQDIRDGGEVESLAHRFAGGSQLLEVHADGLEGMREVPSWCPAFLIHSTNDFLFFYSNIE
jgi:hypothetical protein